MIRIIFAVVFSAVCPAVSLAVEPAGGDVREMDRAWLEARFDEVITPAVESALKEPASNDQGGIAWGLSYPLSDLAEMLDVTRDPKYADLFVKLGRHVAAARDDRRQRGDAIRGRIVPAWGASKYSEGKHYAWAVHTGMIVAPMARFAAVVKNDQNLSRSHGEEAEFFLKVAQEAVAVHADQYREGPGDDEGYLFGLWLKKPLPLNQQNALARAWIHIDDATGRRDHRERIARLARFLKHRLRPTEDGAYAWDYWAPLDGPGKGFEDISHAAINVDFLVLCFEHDIVFTKDDLARLEQTLLHHVIRSDDAIADRVRGEFGTNKYAQAVFRWARLARRSPAVHHRLAALFRANRIPSVDFQTYPAAIASLRTALGKKMPE